MRRDETRGINETKNEIRKGRGYKKEENIR